MNKPTHSIKEVEIMLGGLEQYRMCMSARELLVDASDKVAKFLADNEFDNGGKEWFIVTGRLYGDDECQQKIIQAHTGSDAWQEFKKAMSEGEPVEVEGPGYIYLDTVFHCGICKPKLA